VPGEGKLPPAYDDAGSEVIRDVLFGQRELATTIGTTSVHVKTLPRHLGLVEADSKDATGGALSSGAGLYISVHMVDKGPVRYAR
jgi:hypothetical protein